MINNLLNISKEEIGKRVLSERKARRITIKDISEKTGLSIGSISEIERGKSFPSAQALMAFSLIFECTTDYLLFGTTSNSNIPTFSREEQTLLEIYRTISSFDKYELLEIAKIKSNRPKNST